MGKINIVKPTGGADALNYISAFKADGNAYVIFDSEKTGSMGLPIIYVCKYVNNKLEKINDSNEWQSVKNYLKGIIGGTNFEYIRIPESLNADEVYYMPLTLPQASFDLIKNRYVVNDSGVAGVESSSGGVSSPAVGPNGTMPNSVTAEKLDPPVPPTPITLENAQNSIPEVVSNAPSVNLGNESSVMPTPAASVSTVVPDNNVQSNIVVNETPINNPASQVAPPSIAVQPQPVDPMVSNVNVAPSVSNASSVVDTKIKDIGGELINSFDSDRETFLKACENMFDALISKYQKQLADLDRREQEILRKEKEIETKLYNANEHLANAEAREQVANIAHDNAQKVMDLNNFMPVNPNTGQTGVI